MSRRLFCCQEIEPATLKKTGNKGVWRIDRQREHGSDPAERGHKSEKTCRNSRFAVKEKTGNRACRTTAFEGLCVENAAIICERNKETVPNQSDTAEDSSVWIDGNDKYDV
jgi:hypothetical protein